MSYFGIFAAILLVQGATAAAAASLKSESQAAFASRAENWARDDEFPYHVSVQKTNDPANGGYAHVCSGVLVSERSVLTAASCVSTGGTFLVKAGSVDQTYNDVERVQTFFSENHTIHKDYDPKNKFSANNIALLKLDAPIKLTPYVRPAKLPASGEKFNSSAEYFVTGWGINAKHNPELKYFKAHVIDHEFCRASLKHDIPDSSLASSELCAKHPREPICTHDGDSGSPLAKVTAKGEATLLGFASAITCGDKDSSDQMIFVNVADYLDWIKTANAAPAVTYGYLVLFVVLFNVAKNLFV